MDYGAGNLTFLIQCDSNYTDLVKTLYQWGNYLYKQGLTENAAQVLEYGIKCGTDIAANYTLLARYYKEHGNMTSLQELMEKAKALPGTRKDSIVEELGNFLI
jgi:tetratricopeptide (TPR) repeat protein